MSRAVLTATPSLSADIEQRALQHAKSNAIAHVGDLVETKRSGWKKPKKVRIVSVGAHLIARWSKEVGFFLDFDMTYVAHRIRKDGSSSETVPESGICLSNVKTADGKEWHDRALNSRDATWFNHTALSWNLENARPSGRAALAPSAESKGETL
jgi:hypothetical protein